MSAIAAINEEARAWATKLERREIERSGCSVPAARKAVARKIGVAPGTLENIARRRTKGVRGWIVEALRVAFVQELQKEIERLSHEREMALRGGNHTDADQAREVEAYLAEARRVLGSGL